MSKYLKNGGAQMKPIIGISTNFSYNDEVGISLKIGGSLQHWHLIADDYIKAVELAGGIPILIPLYDNYEYAKEISCVVDGIIFSGGNDIDPQHYGERFTKKVGAIVPERDKQEIELAKDIMANSKMPVLGICRGMQILNVAAGGSLYQDLGSINVSEHFVATSPKYHVVHDIKLRKNSRINMILKEDTLNVNSYHHQAIKDVSNMFEVAATTDEGVIEAIETKEDRFVMGVQWHPEMLVTRHKEHLEIFESFINACAEFKSVRCK